MYAFVVCDCSQGVFLYRYSFESDIVARYKEIDMILLFYGFSKLSLLSAAGTNSSALMVFLPSMVLAYKLYMSLYVCLCVAMVEEGYDYFYLQQKSVNPASLGQFHDFPLAIA